MPGAVIEGIIVEQRLPSGLELIIGGKTDAAFGKVITIGCRRDSGRTPSRRVHPGTCPLMSPRSAPWCGSFRSYRLIQGYRNQPARDEEAFVSAIAAAARWFFSDPRVTEFDLNPLMLYQSGGCAVDARVYADDMPAPVVTEEKQALPERTLKIHSIAVVGASQDPNKVGYAITRNLLSFPGSLSPVNRKPRRSSGVPHIRRFPLFRGASTLPLWRSRQRACRRS